MCEQISMLVAKSGQRNYAEDDRDDDNDIGSEAAANGDRNCCDHQNQESAARA